ncbi:hypothetical protein LOK49_LG01G03168 [Camellia lanceoleosa]|uniref:Uncharacterized protein n=1 Tax=Camellia lanceoleosa TaxID=1840588 RepID=A0ACC0J1F7_9ERIC|nr:hypothetical protein LOK49_LG01G03168 [Camellia lanceoleosa]
MEAHLVQVQVQLSPFLLCRPRPLRCPPVAGCKSLSSASPSEASSLASTSSLFAPFGTIGVEKDITKPQCQAAIKRLMAQNGCQVFDLVLHDGSSNVGGAWAQNATS